MKKRKRSSIAAIQGAENAATPKANEEIVLLNNTQRPTLRNRKFNKSPEIWREIPRTRSTSKNSHGFFATVYNALTNCCPKDPDAKEKLMHKKRK